MECASISATPEPLGAVLPLLEGLHGLISATSVLPSLQPLCLLLSICRAAGLLSSTQLPAQGALLKARHAVGQRGQSWGWEKMDLLGWALSTTPLALTPESLPQQAHGHPLWCGWAGERRYWFVHLGELLAN